MNRSTISENVLCTLDHLGLIGFTGEDAQGFLQGQLTNDIRLVTPGRSQLAGYCTAKGRLLATFLLWKSTDGYCGQLHGAIAAAVQKRLAMYVLRSRVTLRDAAGEWRRFGVAGTHCAMPLEAMFGTLPQQPMDTLQHEGTTLIRLHGSLPRFEIITAPAAAAALWDALAAHCRPVESTHWEWLEIHAGVPQIGPGTQEEFVPQMVNLDLLEAISFKKGCYTGQEIVARTHYLGKVKRRTHLAHADVASPPAPGTLVFGTSDGEAVGMVVNAAPAPGGGCDLLAEVRLESVEAGPLHLGSMDGPTLSLMPMPYAI
jgi:hypothetical protein